MTEKKIEHQRFGSDFGSHIILAVAILSLVIGFIYTPDITEIANGLWRIILHHHRIDSELITVAGSTGAVWVNASIISFFVWGTYKLFKEQVNGLELAAFGQIFGYAFYAESLLNIWPLFIGFMLEAKLNKKDLSKSVWGAWFSTALAPFVSTLAFNVDLINPGSPFAIIFATVVGLILGFGVGAFASYLKTLHKGRLLFNVGFTTGVVGWVGNNALKALNIVQEPVADQTYIEGRNIEFWLVFMLINLLFIIGGMIYNGGFKHYRKNLFWNRTFGGDYVEEFGIGTALINMGVVGTLALSYTLATPYGQLNGPVIGGVFTVAGFAASGITIRGLAPIWVGIYGGSLLMGGFQGLFLREGFIQGAFARVSSRAMTVAAMHGLGSTPVSEKDGWKSGAMVGFLHTMNVVNTGWLNGWMQSYNNGFSQGLVITLFRPIWYFFSKERKQEKLANN